MISANLFIFIHHIVVAIIHKTHHLYLIRNYFQPHRVTSLQVDDVRSARILSALV